MSSLREEGVAPEHEEGSFLVTDLPCWVGFDYKLPVPEEAERPVERGSREVSCSGCVTGVDFTLEIEIRPVTFHLSVPPYALFAQTHSPEWK